MTSLIDRIRQMVLGKKLAGPPTPASPDSEILDGPAMQRLMGALSYTRDEELCCGDVYQLIDEYADYVVEDENAAELMPLVAHHINMCSDCKDEYKLLLKTLGIDDDPATFSRNKSST